MPTPRKIVSIQTKHLSKKERAEREAAMNQFKATTGGLDPPNWLPEEGKREFSRVVEAAEASGQLDDLDFSTLCIYAKNWAVFVSASKKVFSGGLVKNKSSLSPYLIVAERAEDALHKCSTKLGLSAVDRTRLVKPKEPEKPVNKFARYIDA